MDVLKTSNFYILLLRSPKFYPVPSGSTQTPPHREGGQSPTSSHLIEGKTSSLLSSSDSEGRGGGASPSLSRHCWVISPDQGVDLAGDRGGDHCVNDATGPPNVDATRHQGDALSSLTEEAEEGSPIQFKVSSPARLVYKLDWKVSWRIK